MQCSRSITMAQLKVNWIEVIWIAQMQSHSITMTFNQCDLKMRSTRCTSSVGWQHPRAQWERCSIFFAIISKRLHWIRVSTCTWLPRLNAILTVDRKDFAPRRQRRLIFFAMILKRSPLDWNRLHLIASDCSQMCAFATGFPWRARAAAGKRRGHCSLVHLK